MELPKLTVRTDTEVTSRLAQLVEQVLSEAAPVVDELKPEGRKLDQTDITIVAAHNDQVPAPVTTLSQAGVDPDSVVVSTTNKVQGSRVRGRVRVASARRTPADATAFHLEAGRMCVMLSRHRQSCVVVGQANRARLLAEFPDADPVFLDEPDKLPRRLGGEQRSARPPRRIPAWTDGPRPRPGCRSPGLQSDDHLSDRQRRSRRLDGKGRSQMRALMWNTSWNCSAKQSPERSRSGAHPDVTLFVESRRRADNLGRQDDPQQSPPAQRGPERHRVGPPGARARVRVRRSDRRRVGPPALGDPRRFDVADPQGADRQPQLRPGTWLEVHHDHSGLTLVSVRMPAWEGPEVDRRPFGPGCSSSSTDYAAHPRW